MLKLRGGNALSAFRLDKLNQALQADVPGISHIHAEYWHFAETSRELAAAELSVLEKILTYGPASPIEAPDGELLLVVPRLGTISPWSTNPKLTEGKRHIFRACFTDDFQGVVVAALIYAVYPGAVTMPAMVLSETLFTFLLALAVLAFIKCCLVKTTKATLLYMALFSFISGLVALTRSVALALPVLLVIYFIIHSIVTKRKPRLTLAGVLLSIMVFGLALMPWALRNHRMTGRFMVGSTSSGITFFWHNTPMMWTPGSDYISADIKLSGLKNFSGREGRPLPNQAWHPLIKQMQDKFTGRPDDFSRSEFFMQEGLKYLENLSFYDIIKLKLTKLWRLVQPYHQFYNPVYDFIFISLLPFFIYGLYLMLFKTSLFPNKQYFILVTLLGYLGLVTLVFGGMPRYRYPFDPYIFIIAVTGFLEYLNREGKRWLLPAIWAGLNITIAVLLMFV